MFISYQIHASTSELFLGPYIIHADVVLDIPVTKCQKMFTESHVVSSHKPLFICTMGLICNNPRPSLGLNRSLSRQGDGMSKLV